MIILCPDNPDVNAEAFEGLAKVELVAHDHCHPSAESLVQLAHARALREEFERDLPGAFTWEDVASGPAEWRVRIGRA